MTHSPTETEIKLAVPDARTARKLLRSAGFTLARRRVFESNVVFDTPRARAAAGEHAAASAAGRRADHRHL
jgi:hypothetical protein